MLPSSLNTKANVTHLKIFLFILIVSIKSYALNHSEAEPGRQGQVNETSDAVHRMPLTNQEKREIYNYHLFTDPETKVESLEEVEAKASKVRDIVHNLDLTDPEELRISNAYLYDFIKDNEEFHPYAKAIYDYEIIDKQLTKVLKRRHIGYGFDMNRPQGKAEWDTAFKGELSFDAATKKKIRLTRDQAHTLLVSRVTQCQKELSEIYKPYWERIKANEQHTLVDIYYVSGAKYVGKGTKIYENTMKYYETNDIQFHKAVNKEILKLPE